MLHRLDDGQRMIHPVADLPVMGRLDLADIEFGAGPIEGIVLIDDLDPTVDVGTRVIDLSRTAEASQIATLPTSARSDFGS